LKENYISINKEKTKLFFTEKVLNKVSEAEKQESEKTLSASKQIFEEKILKTNKFSTPIILKENTVEFTVCVLNECFKKELNQELIISNKTYSDSVTKYYLNNLITPYDTEEENPTTLLNFSDTDKFNFEAMRNNKQLTHKFCEKVEAIFKAKYGDTYTFEILTIKKGSKQVLVNTNLPPQLFDEFRLYINQNAEKDLGAAQEVKQQKNLRELKFTADMIDTRGNMDFSNLGETQRRGGLPYFQPKGWIRIGLKVSGKYGPNDKWLAMDGNLDEWAVGFHGLKDITKSNLIINGNLISKDNWAHGCQTHTNLNVNTKSVYSTCGKGVYFGDKIEVCETGGYTGSCLFGGKTIKLAFQCRLNPKEIRITQYSPSQAYIVPNQRNDNYTNIRPYGILLKTS